MAQQSKPLPKELTGYRFWLNLIKTRLYSKWQAYRFLKSGGRKMAKRHGTEICVVAMKGARTGKTRHIPLMHVPNGDGILLVASLGGAAKNPAWYYNLLVNPDIEVQVKDRKLKLHARLASAEEKGDIWPICIKHYPTYESYQSHSPRDIPVFICEASAK